MAVSDWSTNADLSTSIDDIDISEHCPAKNMNDAVRAIMANVKSAHGKDGDGNVITSTYAVDSGVVHKTGDETIAGVKTFSHAIRPKGGVYADRNGQSLVVGVGASWNDDTALILHSTGREGADAGRFSLLAGAASCSLTGAPDGTLTWGGKSVERVDSSGNGWIRYASGLQVCWGNVTSGNISITLGKAFKSNTSYSVNVTLSSGDFNVTTSTGSHTASSFGLYVKYSNGNTYNGNTNWIAIGTWK